VSKRAEMGSVSGVEWIEKRESMIYKNTLLFKITM
jgi:hypothetical protein